MLKRCKHEWKILSKETLPSLIEQNGGDWSFDTTIYGAKMAARKTNICICCCDKCGKIVKFTTVNPE